MDIIDNAQLHEHQAINIAVRLQQAAIERDRRDYCIECGDKIPEQRVSCWCVKCKSEIEKMR